MHPSMIKRHGDIKLHTGDTVKPNIRLEFSGGKTLKYLAKELLNTPIACGF